MYVAIWLVTATFSAVSPASSSLFTTILSSPSSLAVAKVVVHGVARHLECGPLTFQSPNAFLIHNVASLRVTNAYEEARLSHAASHWRPPLPLSESNTSRFSHRLF